MLKLRKIIKSYTPAFLGLHRAHQLRPQIICPHGLSRALPDETDLETQVYSDFWNALCPFPGFWKV